MADYVVKLSGQDNLTPTINNVKNALNGVNSTSTGLDKIQERFNKIQNSTAPLQRKLKDIKNLMAQLNINGDSNSPIYNQMAQAAGQYADAISDARAATNRFASDTMNLEAAASALQGVAAAGSIATGIMGMFGTKNEEVERAILKVQSAIAILNGVQSIANILNKDSVLIQKLKQIRIAASTKATISETTAITANTVAGKINTSGIVANTVVTKAWNVVKAISKALLGDFTGLLIVGAGALATYAIATDKSSDSLEEQAKSTDKVKEAQENYQKKVADAVGTTVGKFMVLKNEWSRLRTEAEKTDWLQKNQNEFETLGLKVDDLVSAESIFNNQTGAVVKAFEARAKAAAAMEMVTEAYKQYYEELNRIDTTVAGGGYYETYRYKGPKELSDYQGSKYNKKTVIDNYGLKEGEHYSVRDVGYNKFYTLNDKGLAEVEKRENQKRNDEALKRRNENRKKADEELSKQTNTLYKEIEKSQKELDESTAKQFLKTNNSNTPKSTTNSSKTNKKSEVVKTQLEIDEDALKVQEDKVKKAIERFNKGLISKEQLETIVNDANEYFKENNIKSNVKLEYSTDDNGFETVTDKITKKDPVKIKTELEIKREQFQDIQNSIREATDDFNSGLIDSDVLNSKIDEINYKLKELGIDPIQLQFDDAGAVEALDGYKQKLKELSDAEERAQTIASENDKFYNSLSSTFGSLGSAIGGTTGNIMGFAAQSIQAMSQVLPQIVALIGAKQAEAMASGTASAASLPFPANIAAIASIVATIASIFAALPTFAEGGIVGGSSMVGDHLLARVNSGEMILNGKQQDNLFNAIDNNRLGGEGINGVVDFRIDGTVIKGVLRNVENKLAKQS